MMRYDRHRNGHNRKFLVFTRDWEETVLHVMSRNKLVIVRGEEGGEWIVFDDMSLNYQPHVHILADTSKLQ